MKAILVIDMPRNCNECEVKCDGYTAKQYAEKSIIRPNWCPLRPLPFFKTETIDVDGLCHTEEVINALKKAYINMGYNKCVCELMGVKDEENDNNRCS